ncbi:MAG: helix-turn-helix domain-containing protein [Planctomycetota bacterium]|jgi:transcriptional regulator with XRE-family HTH domain
MVMTAKIKLSDQLRAAIRNSGKTIYRIAKDCGIAEPHLHFFLNGQRGLGVEKIDRLAEYLRLELRKKTSKKQKKD